MHISNRPESVVVNIMKLNHENSFLLGDGWVLADLASGDQPVYLYRCPKVNLRVALSMDEKYIPPGEYVNRIKFAIFYLAPGSDRDDRKPVIIYKMDGKILFGYAYIY